MTFAQRYERWIEVLWQADKGGKGDAGEQIVRAKQRSEIVKCLKNYKELSIPTAKSKRDEESEMKIDGQMLARLLSAKLIC